MEFISPSIHCSGCHVPMLFERVIDNTSAKSPRAFLCGLVVQSIWPTCYEWVDYDHGEFLVSPAWETPRSSYLNILSNMQNLLKHKPNPKRLIKEGRKTEFLTKFCWYFGSFAKLKQVLLAAMLILPYLRKHLIEIGVHLLQKLLSRTQMQVLTKVVNDNRRSLVSFHPAVCPTLHLEFENKSIREWYTWRKHYNTNLIHDLSSI